MRLFGYSVGKLRVRSPRRLSVGRQAFGVTALAMAAWLASAPAHADDVKWTLGVDGRWNVAANWTDTTDNTNHEPTSSDEVMNDTGAAITLDGVGYANTFTSNGDLNIVAGTLNVNSLLDSLNGAKIVVSKGSNVFFNSPNATVRGEVLFQTNASNGSSNFLAAENGQTLVLDENANVHGSSADIGAYYDGGYKGGSSIINNGVISSDVNGGSLYVYTLNTDKSRPAATFTNNGTLQAINGGYLGLQMEQGGSLGGTIQAVGSGSIVSLYGASPFGGLPEPTISLADGTVFRASSGGRVTLNFVATYDGGGNSLIVDDGYLTLGGATLKNAVVNLTGNGQGLQAGSGLVDNVRVNGQLLVVGQLRAMNTLHADDLLFGPNPDFPNSGAGIVAQVGQTLTLDETTKVHGIGTVGTVPIPGSFSGNLVNNGLISADVNGGALNIYSGIAPLGTPFPTFTNTGVLEAINGGLLNLQAVGGLLGGTVQALGDGSRISITGGYGANALNFADGTVFRASSGGQIVLGGYVDFDGQGHSIAIDDGYLTLNSGTLHNTTVNLTGTGQGVLIQGGALDNVTINTALALNTGSVTVINSLNVPGGITISNENGVYTTPNAILNTPEILFSGTGGLLSAQVNTPLTISAGTTVHGQNGEIGHAVLYGQDTGGNLANNGTISADVSGQPLTVRTLAGTTFANNGTLEARNGGTLNVNVVNGTSTGTIRAGADSTVSLNGVTQTAGTTTADGTLMVGTGSNPFVVSGGTVNGTGTIQGDVNNTGGVLSPGDSPGTLTLTGNYSQGSAASMFIELGGDQQGQTYDLFQVGGTATLVGTLNIELIDGFIPTVGQTFDFLTYGSHVGQFDTVFSVTNGYAYTVNYGATGATLVAAAVPEPGLIVSLPMGLGLLAMARRKKRQALSNKW